MIRPTLTIAGFLALAACSHDPSTSRPPSAALCTLTDTDSLGPDPFVGSFSGNVRARLDSLERRLRTASDTDRPALLLALGYARSAYEPSAREGAKSYATARPDAYRFNEVGADYLYTGSDFRELLKRFPASSLADDAAYALTRLDPGGECEDSQTCYIGITWLPVAEFLRARPHARQVGFAVRRALVAFRQADSIEDLRVAGVEDDAAGIHNLLASLDTIARLLPPPGSTRLLLRAGDLWERYGEYDRAKSAYDAALAGADTAARACIEPRLAALPARWFELDTTHVINPYRVDLRWQSPGVVADTLEVYRSNARLTPGTVVARLGGNALAWSDTTTQPGVIYWYRIAIAHNSEHVQTNPASARTPTLDLNVQRIAVSTSDKRLYIFGRLSNAFPQVVSISGDGASVERLGGIMIGVDNNMRDAHTFETYARDAWLVDGGGVGVLRFPTTGERLPPELIAALRFGKEEVSPNFAQAPGNVLAAVDEPNRAAWLGTNTGSMDCVSIQSLCWVGLEGAAELRDGHTGLARVRIPLTDVVPNGKYEFPGAVYANPRDSSAWMWMTRAGRLAHLMRDGTVGPTVILTNPRASAYSIAMAGDRERRTIWMTRGTQLVRLDMDAAKPDLQVVATIAAGEWFIAPDLSGGVWLVSRTDARRIDAGGKTLFTIPLRAKR